MDRPDNDPIRDRGRNDPKPEESRRDWEDVQSNATDKTERLKVHSGWLYRTGNGTAIALCYVPESRG